VVVEDRDRDILDVFLANIAFSHREVQIAAGEVGR